MSDLGNLSKNLLAKYKSGNLASVYLAKYPENTDPEIWAREFLKNITPLTDHPDVLWVSRGEKENDYKVDSAGIAALLKFLNYRAFELKTKFIFIKDAHLLSVIVSNKLLKVFEELPENFCLFLFAPQEENLLPTVESRALKILIPKDIDATPALDLPSFTSAQELLGVLKKSENEFAMEKRFIEESLDKSLKTANFKDCVELLENLKTHSIGDSFNNSKLSRLSLFFN